MSIRPRPTYEEPESSTFKWVSIFVLLSLLAHVLIISVILLITLFVPVPKIIPPEPPPPTVSLSLLSPPPPTMPHKPIFIPTPADTSTPHKPQNVESAYDHVLTSKNQTPRKPDTPMPDITGKPHNNDLNTKPQVQNTQKPEVSSTPPTAKSTEAGKPTPPQPKPQDAKTPPPPKPPPPAPKPLKPPPPQLDPNGFPVLPPLSAPTLAPPNSGAPSLAPAPSDRQQAADVHGAIGQSGDNSPAAMATELGKYKQYVHTAVGSWWYPDINQHFGTIGVGTVHIQFTIHSDGTITDVTVLEGDNLEILKVISKHALIAPAPYKPFSDAMIKQVGDSYTDDYEFSIYGN